MKWCRKENVPSDLLDELADERSPLAKVALGAAHTRLADAGGGLLYSGKSEHISQGPSSADMLRYIPERMKQVRRSSTR